MESGELEVFTGDTRLNHVRDGGMVGEIPTLKTPLAAGTSGDVEALSDDGEGLLDDGV